MMKKTAFGIIGAGAAALITLGAAAPAMASGLGDHGHGDSSYSSSTTNANKSFDVRNIDYKYQQSSWTPIVVSPSVNVGDVASGDLDGNTVGSNDPLLSGDQVTAPIASGNQTPIASGNDTAVSGNAVGNGTTDNLLSGNDISNMVKNTTDNVGNTVTNTVTGITESSSRGW